jgi:myo-inositol-1(or 4)-monophosphatase
MDFWTQVLSGATEVTKPVIQRLLQDFGQVQAAEKEDGSLVTASDKWADEALRTAIAQRFPNHGVLSEEAVHVFPDQEWCWVIDPIDGTTNFARGIPIWGVSLGLLHWGMPVFGYVAIPPLRDIFYGFWDDGTGLNSPTGAFLNQRPIHASSANLSKNEFFSLCARSIQVLQNPFPCKIRMLGVASYNLLMVGAGITLGGVEATPKVWDLAGIWPILLAAGAVCEPLADTPFPLHVGDDYSDRAFPTLVVSRPDFIPILKPLTMAVIKGS